MTAHSRIEPSSGRLLKIREVCGMVGFGKTKIYALVKEGAFPQPLKPGGVSTRWSEPEIVDWVERLRASRPANAA